MKSHKQNFGKLGGERQQLSLAFRITCNDGPKGLGRSFARLTYELLTFC